MFPGLGHMYADASSKGQKWLALGAASVIGTAYMGQSYLSLGDPDATSYTHGGLKNNYNPMADQYEHNYVPDNKGGFFEVSCTDYGSKVYKNNGWTDELKITI